MYKLENFGWSVSRPTVTLLRPARMEKQPVRKKLKIMKINASKKTGKHTENKHSKKGKSKKYIKNNFSKKKKKKHRNKSASPLLCVSRRDILGFWWRSAIASRIATGVLRRRSLSVQSTLFHILALRASNTTSFCGCRRRTLFTGY